MTLNFIKLFDRLTLASVRIILPHIRSPCLAQFHSLTNMSDEPSPPPKPKPGSLRDRIAAFENKSSASPSLSPPLPRPKPGGLTWKPKPPSPPSSPGSPADQGLQSPERRNFSGMSASDAKESIGKGGSLKDRMAALQGKGAFGAPPPPLAPKPAFEKPRWKPPPVISPLPEDGNDGETAHEHQARPSVKPPIILPKSPVEGPADPVVEEETQQSVTGDETASNNPEEEERQRRANIAARMARLGGTRVGMAPPVFGRKPSLPKETMPKEDVNLVPTPKEEVPSESNVAVDSVTESECFYECHKMIH
jgi:hypothetical protein